MVLVFRKGNTLATYKHQRSSIIINDTIEQNPLFFLVQYENVEKFLQTNYWNEN